MILKSESTNFKTLGDVVEHVSSGFTPSRTDFDNLCYGLRHPCSDDDAVELRATKTVVIPECIVHPKHGEDNAEYNLGYQNGVIDTLTEVYDTRLDTNSSAISTAAFIAIGAIGVTLFSALRK